MRNFSLRRNTDPEKVADRAIPSKFAADLWELPLLIRLFEWGSMIERHAVSNMGQHSCYPADNEFVELLVILSAKVVVSNTAHPSQLLNDTRSLPLPDQESFSQYFGGI